MRQKKFCAFCGLLCAFCELLLEALVDRLDPTIGLDEAGAPWCPLGRQTFGLDLVQRFSGRNLLPNDLGRLLEHPVI